MNYAQRLSRLVKVFGITCPLHNEEALTCPTCEPQEPYPEPVATGMGNLIEAIIARVPREVLTAAALRVPRLPVHELCGCGARLQCIRCQVRQGHALLAAIKLNPDERAMLENLLETCRMIDTDP